MAGVVELQRLLVRLTGDNTQYRQVLKQTERQTKMYVDKSGRVHDALTHKFVKNNQKMILQLNMLGRTMMMTGEKMVGMGRTLALKLTAPLMLLGGLAARAFAKFDSAMTQSIAIMDVTASQIERMTNLAREMSASGQVLQGADELARSYFFLASAGKDAEQSMRLLGRVSQFATAGMFDMATATDLLTDAQSALGLSVKDVAQDEANLVRVSDVLVKANTLANATVQQFSTALTRKAGAAFKVYGKDVEEGVAVLAAFADQGVKAELAGTALDRIMRLMSKGAIDNAKAHKALGFEVFDQAGKMRNLGDIIKNLEDVLRGMSDEQRAVALDMLGFEARVQGVLLPLIGTSKAIKKYEKQLRDAGGTTKKVADEQMKSFGARIKVVWNQMKGLAIEIGKTLAPALKGLGSVFGGLANWFTKWPAWIKAIVAAIAALLMVLGPLLIILGTVTRAIGFLGVGLTSLTAKLGLSKMAILSWKSAWVAVMAIGIIVFLNAAAKAADRARRELARLNEERMKAFAEDEEMRQQERARLAKELIGKGGVVPRAGLEVLVEQTEKDRQRVVRETIAARKELALQESSIVIRASRVSSRELQEQVYKGKQERMRARQQAGAKPAKVGGRFALGQPMILQHQTEEIRTAAIATAQANLDRMVAHRKQVEKEQEKWEGMLKPKKEKGQSISERFLGPMGVVGQKFLLHGEMAGDRFVWGFKRKLNEIKDAAKDLKLDQDLAKQVSLGLRTPKEILQDRQAELSRLLDVRGGLTGGMFDRGMARAMEEYKTQAIQRAARVVKARGGLTTAAKDFSGTQVARAGSAEMLSRIIQSRVSGADPQEKQVTLLEEIKELLREEGIVVTIKDLAAAGFEGAGA